MPTFTLNDSKGIPHLYEFDLHVASDGAPIAYELAALVVEPLAQAIQEGGKAGLFDKAIGDGAQVAEVAGDAGGTLAALLDGGADDVLGRIDLSSVATKIRPLFGSLGKGLDLRILQLTRRDGQPLAPGGKATGAFNEAYRGNYLELLQALWGVARGNGFLPLPGI